jgi:hypothetical protein
VRSSSQFIHDRNNTFGQSYYGSSYLNHDEFHL